jgi:hypothetical protein
MPSACALAASASFFFCYSYVQVALKVQVVIAAVDACMVCSELRASWPWGIADLGRPEQGRRLVVTVASRSAGGSNWAVRGAADREPSRPSPPPLVFSLVRRQQCLRQQRLLLLSLFPDFCVARPWFTSHSPQERPDAAANTCSSCRVVTACVLAHALEDCSMWTEPSGFLAHLGGR